MGWNGSGKQGETDVMGNVGTKHIAISRRMVWVVTGLVLAGCATAVYFLIQGNDASPEAKTPIKKPTNAIAEVKPAIVTNVVSEKAEKKEPYDPYEGLKPGEHRKVNWKRPANWDQLSPQQKTRIQPIGRVIKPLSWGRKRLFTERSDCKIERLLRHEPGKILLGTGQYGEQFKQDFLESIKVPIIVSKDDSPEDAAMKKAVIATRLDLKDALDRGEDISKIMEDTERQLRQMAGLRENLRRELMQLRNNDGITEQELSDYVSAANKMLSDNGIEPLKYANFWYNKARLNDLKRQEGKTK